MSNKCIHPFHLLTSTTTEGETFCRTCGETLKCWHPPARMRGPLWQGDNGPYCDACDLKLERSCCPHPEHARLRDNRVGSMLQKLEPGTCAWCGRDLARDVA